MHTHTHNADNKTKKQSSESPEKLMLCNFQHVKPQSDMKAFRFMTKVDAKLSMFDLFIEVLFVSFPFVVCFVRSLSLSLSLHSFASANSNVSKLNFSLKRYSIRRCAIR